MEIDYKKIFKNIKSGAKRNELEICDEWLNNFDSFKKWCDKNYCEDKQLSFKLIKDGEKINKFNLKFLTRSEIMILGSDNRFDRKEDGRIEKKKNAYLIRFCIDKDKFSKYFKDIDQCRLYRNYKLFVYGSIAELEKIDYEIKFDKHTNSFFFKKDFIKRKVFISDKINVKAFLEKINNL